MATTSLWRVHGRVDKVVSYAENSDKTIAKGIAEDQIDEAENDIDSVIRYVSRFNATAGKKWFSGINCTPETAIREMVNTKEADGRTGGVVAYHGYQSFAEGEVTPDQAHAIGVELATELWGDRFEVIVATHVDKESHIHNHFVINTVPIDGSTKFHRTSMDYKKMQEVSDRLCRENGLSVVKKTGNRGMQYSEWLAEQNGKPTYRSMVRRDIDEAVKAADTDKEFFQYLKEKGYEFKLYTDKGRRLERPSLRPKDSVRYFRFDRLGYEYRLDEIMGRILEEDEKHTPLPEGTKDEIRKYRLANPVPLRLKGFAALYYHYCIELHITARFPASAKRVSFFMREDLRKLDRLDEQTRFLAEENIGTLDELNQYREMANEKVHTLEWERQMQRNNLRQCLRKEDAGGADETKKTISGISDEIKKLRRNLLTCDSVEKRAGQMKEELELIREENRKGEKENELFRRRSGTNRENVPKRG